MEIIWTTEAKKSFKKNVTYLKEKWTIKEVDAYTLKVYGTIELLQNFPNLGVYDQDLQCSKITIIKQVTLLYDVNNGHIEIISFWNNKRKPIKKLS